jgi:RHS repeat-associated protein
MNLNGVEYYYIRNAQGDIIGLFDKSGAQVVSYTYDTWGKLIAIGGSLKDSVGVKNPYRYRGYRYDTETGLYYLQSRYYNPEWGRFINADGIIGQTGELLGHNLYVYTKNNPVNMSDKSGFRPIYTMGEETEEMVAASVAVVARAAKNRSSRGKSSAISTISSMRNDLYKNANKYGKEAAEDPWCREPAVLAVDLGSLELAGIAGIIVTLGIGQADNFDNKGVKKRLAEGIYTSGNYKAAAQLSQTEGQLMAWDAVSTWWNEVSSWLDENAVARPKGTLLEQRELEEGFKKWHGMQ